MSHAVANFFGRPLTVANTSVSWNPFRKKSGILNVLHAQSKRNRIVSKHGRINTYVRSDASDAGRSVADINEPKNVKLMIHLQISQRFLHKPDWTLVELDDILVFRLLLRVLGSLCCGLVPDCPGPWRSWHGVSGEQSWSCCLCWQCRGLHNCIPLQFGNSTYHRVKRILKFRGCSPMTSRQAPPNWLFIWWWPGDEAWYLVPLKIMRDYFCHKTTNYHTLHFILQGKWNL